jgi:hypothetical protein
LATRCLRAYRHVPHSSLRAYLRVPHSSGGSWNLWAGNKDRKFGLNADFHGTFRDLLRAEEFSALKNPRLRPGLNPRTWVPEASTLTPRRPKPLRRRLLTSVSIYRSTRYNNSEDNKLYGSAAGVTAAQSGVTPGTSTRVCLVLVDSSAASGQWISTWPLIEGNNVHFGWC